LILVVLFFITSLASCLVQAGMLSEGEFVCFSSPPPFLVFPIFPLSLLSGGEEGDVGIFDTILFRLIPVSSPWGLGSGLGLGPGLRLAPLFPVVFKIRTSCCV
jgi:hypothetical protein